MSSKRSAASIRTVLSEIAMARPYRNATAASFAAHLKLTGAPLKASRVMNRSPKARQGEEKRDHGRTGAGVHANRPRRSPSLSDANGGWPRADRRRGQARRSV